jgi:transcriptional regulator with XRE-family HTH domain
MSTRSKKSDAVQFLEKISGGPLTFGKMLRSIRLGEELSQSDFAEQLGVSKAHLCDIEKGRRIVGPARAWAWGKKLGYSPEQFVELAIEASLVKEGLKYRVKLEVA